MNSSAIQKVEIKETEDFNLFNEFAERNWRFTNFQQSPLWAKVNEGENRIHHYLSFNLDGKLIGTAIIRERKIIDNLSFLLISKGPTINWADQQLTKSVLEALVEYSKDKKNFKWTPIGLRVSPPILRWRKPIKGSVSSPAGEGKENIETTRVLKTLKKIGFRRFLRSIELIDHIKIDLKDKSEHQLWCGLQKDTRYYIKKARKEVKTKISIGEQISQSVIEAHYQLYKMTAKHHGFVPRNRDFIMKAISEFSKRGKILIAVTCVADQPTNSAVIVLWAKKAYYLWAGSNYLYRINGASELLHWEIIKWLRANGYYEYDLMGIAPLDKPKHPWFKYSIFKKSFGGYWIRDVGDYDYRLNPLLYFLFKYSMLTRHLLKAPFSLIN